jgi:hypothetical protein
MVVPATVLVISLLTVMALGIYVVYIGVTNPPFGGPSEISAFGSKLVLKGPAWLIMIAVGALMSATPVIAAVVQQKAQTPFELSAPAQRVAQINEPEYHDFRFLRDVSYLDLRNSLAQPWYASLPGWSRLVGRHVRVRPATLFNYMLVRKVGSSSEIHVTYSTSGLLDVRCLTHGCAVKTTFDGDQNVVELTANVGNVPTNADFVLATEATFWNAFSRDEGEDYTTYTHNQDDTAEDISVVVIFPDQKPFHELKVLELGPRDEKLHQFSGEAQELRGPGAKTYSWATRHVGAGTWDYTVKWTW